MMRGTARECMIKSRQEVPTTYKREVSMWCRVGKNAVYDRNKEMEQQ